MPAPDNTPGSTPDAPSAAAPVPPVLRCSDLRGAIDWFRERLGFRLDTILPADDPREALLSREGLRLTLKREPPAEAPDASTGSRGWITGRAGMRYRDLIPQREGGALIASHIRIEGAGPVPDDVHFHEVRFQMIYCLRGWVRVVYQDQGAPFVLEPGDCVLQPPGIRHRVLEASAGLEVLELSAPAEHPTHFDHDLRLPSERVDATRRYGGQRFVRHQAADAVWTPGPAPGWEQRDLGIRAATKGAADARVLRRTRADTAGILAEAGLARSVWVVLQGHATFVFGEDRPRPLSRSDALTLPADTPLCCKETSSDLELLVVQPEIRVA